MIIKKLWEVELDNDKYSSEVQLSSLWCHSDGSIYVCGVKTKTVYKLDSQGNVVCLIGKRPKSKVNLEPSLIPFTFNFPACGVSHPSGMWMVSDISNNRLYLFNKNDEFIREISLSHAAPRQLALINKKIFGHCPTKDGTMHVYDREGNKLNSWLITLGRPDDYSSTDDKGQPIPGYSYDSGSFVISEDSYVYFCWKLRYAIQQFNLQGEQIRAVQGHRKPIEKSGEDVTGRRHDQLMVADMAYSKMSNRLLLLYGSLEDRKHAVIDVYTNKLEYESSFLLDGPAHKIACDDNDFLYTAYSNITEKKAEVSCYDLTPVLR